MSQSTEKHSELHTIRDTVESIWVAIILAFVLRAFMIEAFVIPTGSMAPRLLGEHHSLQCPSCKYEFDFGRQHEFIGHRANANERPAPRCPTCGYQWDSNGTYKGGDRVLVLKYLYRLTEPQRWDVVVFRNPQDNAQNYIKRLIGLPGEELEIVHGDIFYRKTGQGDPEPWRIARKPARAQKAMWQIVFDNDYRIDPERYASQFPKRKAPAWELTDNAEHWNLTAAEGRNFVFTGSDHLETLEFNAPEGYFLPHYGYNPPDRGSYPKHVNINTDICTDLQLSCTFHPRADDARVYLHLTSFEHHFRASVHADGTVLLERQNLENPTAGWKQWAKGNVGPLDKSKGYTVALEHADMRVTLRVGGKAVLVSKDADYLGGATTDPHALMSKRIAEVSTNPIPRPSVQISASGGASELRHIRITRDVFYTCPPLSARGDPHWKGPRGEYDWNLLQAADPSLTRNRPPQNQPGWGTTGNPITLLKDEQDPDMDEFFVLGDNSPQSLDSRGWVLAAPTLRLYDDDGKPAYNRGTVPRYNMIGKAFFVYWPAGFAIPGLGGLPIIPNVGRMRLIR